MASLPVIEGKPALATMLGRAGLPKMKAGFCVSIVSIVRGRVPGSMAVVSGCTYWTGRRLA